MVQKTVTPAGSSSSFRLDKLPQGHHLGMVQFVTAVVAGAFARAARDNAVPMHHDAPHGEFSPCESFLCLLQRLTHEKVVIHTLEPTDRVIARTGTVDVVAVGDP